MGYHLLRNYGDWFKCYVVEKISCKNPLLILEYLFHTYCEIDEISRCFK